MMRHLALFTVDGGRRGRGFLVGAGLALALSCAAAQDAGKALGGLFQGLLKAAPATGSTSPNEVVNKLIGAPQASGPPHANELIELLSQSINDIDEPKEIEIGRHMAALLLGAKPLDSDMALQAYVNRLGRWISLQSRRPGLPWTFVVLQDTGYNAFAAPGGYVFVTRGLVERMSDESELAGVLAHEISHVVGKHHLKALKKAARSGLLAKAVTAQLRNDVVGGLSARLLDMGRELYARGLDQDDELEADREGIVLATRAGLDPYGLVAVLNQLQTRSPDDQVFSFSFSTHPPPQVRLDQAAQAMGERLDPFADRQKPVTIAQRLHRQRL